MQRRNGLRELSKGDLRSEPNVTPLVDVALVILIVFMIVTPMIGVPVQLPLASAAEPHPESDSQLTVTLFENGAVAVGDRLVMRPELQTALLQIHASTPNRDVVVKADRRLTYGDVASALRDCRDAGFANVGLITKKS